MQHCAGYDFEIAQGRQGARWWKSPLVCCFPWQRIMWRPWNLWKEMSFLFNYQSRFIWIYIKFLCIIHYYLINNPNLFWIYFEHRHAVTVVEWSLALIPCHAQRLIWLKWRDAQSSSSNRGGCGAVWSLYWWGGTCAVGDLYMILCIGHYETMKLVITPHGRLVFVR